MRRASIAALLVACGALAGCGAAGSSAASRGKIPVVAAENFWGSIAAQLGGRWVQVTSIVHSPAADPHDYEPTAADAREMATARLVIVNGVGYDPWAPRLLAANPVQGRTVLTVGDVVGLKAGANPHRWYSPGDVQRVIDAIVAGYRRLDPRHAGYFDAQRARFESRGLARYRQLIALIRRRYAGTPVGASESVFAPLAESLGLRLLTPDGFLNAVSEGTDAAAAAKSAADRQIGRREIKVWVYNSQNATPDVRRLTAEASTRAIPVVTVTETPVPAYASFEDWQARQLEALLRALARGSGR